MKEDDPNAPAPWRPTVASLLISSRLRPPQWTGASAVPSPGSFCGACKDCRWYGNGSGWFCTTCNPQAESCNDGRIVETPPL